jgi:hypothetical protein
MTATVQAFAVLKREGGGGELVDVFGRPAQFPNATLDRRSKEPGRIINSLSFGDL